MVISFGVAVYFEFIHQALGFTPWPSHWTLVAGVAITTAVWLLVTFLPPPADHQTLQQFYTQVRPGGRGWQAVLNAARQQGHPIEQTAVPGILPRGILCMVTGSLGVYGAIFAVGYLLYGQGLAAILASVVSVIALTTMFKTARRLS